jgi:hypothetical protein
LVGKIISSGRTGVEMAGLDVAVKLGITHGGWAPRGMRNAQGPLPEQYGLQEVSALGFRYAMEKNIIDSDGTLLVTRGRTSIETRFAVETALSHQRQLLHLDLSQYSTFEAASLASSWIALQRIKKLFISGPSEEPDSKVYDLTKKVLETAFYLGFVKTGLHPDLPTPPASAGYESRKDFPRDLRAAIGRLTETLQLKDRARIANMRSEELDHLRTGLGDYIKQAFGLYSGNTALLQSCAEFAKLSRPLPDEACAVILRALWTELRSTHKLRIIKS